MSNDILEYRMVILDNVGELIKYSFDFGMHQSCLDDFANTKKYSYSSRDYIVGNGNGIFYNFGNQMVGVILPEKLNFEQLYSLDYIENWLYNVSYMEVVIFGKDKKEEFIFEEDIQNNFSKEVIQYYYNNIKKKK